METTMPTQYNTVLSIAGSDSGGGAGIQADIKSISANGGYAATVITATTAQSTQGVFEVHGIPLAHVEAQLNAVLEDIEFGAVKIGMLHSVEVIELIEKAIERYKIKNIVLDPVMVSTSGKKLLNDDAIEGLKRLMPKLLLITPNVPEAEVLVGHAINRKNMEVSAQELGEKYKVSVLLKGGHLELGERMTDILYLKESQKVVTITLPTIKSNNTHGTGCTLSSSIATHISLGCELEEAVRKGCGYVNRAIDAGKNKVLGKGKGPVNHSLC